MQIIFTFLKIVIEEHNSFSVLLKINSLQPLPKYTNDWNNCLLFTRDASASWVSFHLLQGLVVAGLADFTRPAEKLSVSQSGVLTATGELAPVVTVSTRVLQTRARDQYGSIIVPDVLKVKRHAELVNYIKTYCNCRCNRVIRSV